MNRIVKLPSVESFGRLTPDKWLLLKTLEESAEMVEAGKRLVKGDAKARRDLLAEWADVLQTLVNVATAFGITDDELAQAMDDCLVHNQERGRLRASSAVRRTACIRARRGRTIPTCCVSSTIQTICARHTNKGPPVNPRTRKSKPERKRSTRR